MVEQGATWREKIGSSGTKTTGVAKTGSKDMGSLKIGGSIRYTTKYKKQAHMQTHSRPRVNGNGVDRWPLQMLFWCGLLEEENMEIWRHKVESVFSL